MDRTQFYKSKRWQKFRNVIIAQRMDSQGYVHCDICGKPILKKYDLILHHKQELSDANVDDAMVSLNPDLIQCVHFKCHNQLHDRWQGGNGGYRPPKKQVFIVYGAPCSGKSTWVHETATAEDLIVDLDNIWEMISINERFTKPGALKSVVFDIRDFLYDVIKYRRGKWHNAYIITGGALKGDRERLQQRVGADDFIFIDTPKHECLVRCSEHRSDEWFEYINDWFDAFQADEEG